MVRFVLSFVKERELKYGSVLLPVGLVGCMLLASLAGGCAGTQVTQVSGEPDFQRDVIGAKQPVLVYFYKGG